MHQKAHTAMKWKIALGVAVCLAFLADCTKSSPPESALLHAMPISKSGPMLTLPELDNLINENFVVVSDIGKLPESVKLSFCNIEKCNFVGVKFDMVNPGEAMSTDAIFPGIPNKRLRFAAVNDHSAIVFYELGGYVGQLCVTAFDFRKRASWGATLGTSRVYSLDQLRTAISGKQFTQWSPGGRG